MSLASAFHLNPRAPVFANPLQTRNSSFLIQHKNKSTFHASTIRSLQSTTSALYSHNTMQSLRKSLLIDKSFKSYGPLILSASPNVAELLATVGYSHIVVDMEHSPTDISNLTSLLRAIDAASRGAASTHNTSIVRAPSHNDIAMTKRILDVLRPPAGIMFPMIENAQQAEAAVASMRYPPHLPNNNGVRGCAHPFVRASQYGRDEEYFHESSRDLLAIMQVESSEAIERIPEIGMVEGVDMIFLGPFDISCSINQMGNFSEDGEVMELIRKAETLVRETDEKKRFKNISDTSDETPNGLILGGFRSPGRSIQGMFEAGYQFVCGAVDLGMLRDAAYRDWSDAQSAMK